MENQSFENFFHHFERLHTDEAIVRSNIDKTDTEIQATEDKLTELYAERAAPYSRNSKNGYRQ